jgi:GTP-binding protein Era
VTPSFRSGFVSIIGKPNVGKSTLLNRLVGERLAGVSRKPQTTREVIRGILSGSRGQAIFLDTPGFHDPHDRLGEWMLGQIDKAIESSDLICWMVFPGLPREDDRALAERLKKAKIPIFLLVNQVDRVRKPEILPVIDAYQKLYGFREIIPISALKGDNLPPLIRKIFEALPENPPYYPEDLLTDQNERTIVSEMIREKIFRFTGEEIPYSSALEIEEFKERSERLVAIKAAIVVEKDSQKAILIGKGGAKIKQIGEEARREIEHFLGKKVYLELWVKTLKHWKRDPEALKRLGFG